MRHYQVGQTVLTCGSAVVAVKFTEKVDMAPRKAEQVANLRKEVEQVGQQSLKMLYLFTFQFSLLGSYYIFVQLQRELEITRKPLSETIQELIQYTKDNMKVVFSHSDLYYLSIIYGRMNTCSGRMAS